MARRGQTPGKPTPPGDYTAAMTPTPLALDGSTLSFADFESVARGCRPVSLAEQARRQILASNEALIQAINLGVPLYGVNTGFGSLSRTRINDDELPAVQTNLLRSHAACVGEPLPCETVRGMLLLLAASLSRGMSGVRIAVVEQVVALLNAGVTPIVPKTGSVGASGDLAPLAHATLPLIGEGEAEIGGERVTGAEALKRANLTPITLGPKEGLALINGTHLMAAQGALALIDAQRLMRAAIVATAMSIDANRATDAFLDDRVYTARNHDGPAKIAHALATSLKGSSILPSHRADDPRVQDPYSFRCAPVVLGSSLDLINYIRASIERELGAVTDNPLVFSDENNAQAQVISAGNFHGMPIALPLDTLAIALAHIGGLSERRVYHLLAASDSENPLNAHLSPQPGLHSGLMITQYTAAACCNELIHNASPATVANIPTCAGMEDYNSFGPLAADKARRSLSLAANTVAIELLCAAEALEYQRPLKSGAVVERVHECVRSLAPKLSADRPPSPDIEKLRGLILSDQLEIITPDLDF